MSIDLTGTGLGQTETVYTEYYRGRSADGTSVSFAFNATVTRTGVGRWEVRFATPHPDGANYTPAFETEEESNLRDVPDITEVQGSQNANGFDVQITTGDNGGAADAYVDAPWSFGVEAPIELVTTGASFTAADKVFVNVSEFAFANFAQTDIHNNGAPVSFVNTGLEGDWAAGGNVFSYAGSPDIVKGTVNLNAPDGGASSYWARPKLRVREQNSGWECVVDDLVMQDTGTYDGDCTYAAAFAHYMPGSAPVYEFEWFDKENRTATLVPVPTSQIVLEAVTRRETFVIEA